MIRITGTLDAERGAQLLSEKLEEYCLSVEQDIAGLTTDGASVMCKMGKLLPCEHQLCTSHGIHLAVTGCLYLKKGEEEGKNIFLKKILCKGPMKI